MTPEQAAVQAAVQEFSARGYGVYAHQAPAGTAAPYAVVSITTSEDVRVQGQLIGTTVRVRVDVYVAGERAAHPVDRPSEWRRQIGTLYVDALSIGAQAEAYEEGGRPWRRTVLEYSALVRG